MISSKVIAVTFDSVFKECLANLEADPDSQAYLQFHRRRYQYLIQRIQKLGQLHSIQKILDVGPAYQTIMMRKLVAAQIHTLGFLHRDVLNDPTELHYHVDLNHTHSFNQIPEKYDLIVFSEVLEHLYTAPEQVIQFLKQFLRPDGHLIIQTPNAAATYKRIQLLFGQNPFEWIRSNRMGHFREYTLSEIRQLLMAQSFLVIDLKTQNYFGYSDRPWKIVYRKLNTLLPLTFRDGITAIAQLKINQ